MNVFTGTIVVWLVLVSLVIGIDVGPGYIDDAVRKIQKKRQQIRSRYLL